MAYNNGFPIGYQQMYPQYYPSPAAAEQYGNVTSTAIITVPRGCCFNLALRSVAASEDATVTPAPLINLQNANITINRIA